MPIKINGPIDCIPAVLDPGRAWNAANRRLRANPGARSLVPFEVSIVKLLLPGQTKVDWLRTTMRGLGAKHKPWKRLHVSISVAFSVLLLPFTSGTNGSATGANCKQYVGSSCYTKMQRVGITPLCPPESPILTGTEMVILCHVLLRSGLVSACQSSGAFVSSSLCPPPHHGAAAVCSNLLCYVCLFCDTVSMEARSSVAGVQSLEQAEGQGERDA